MDDHPDDALMYELSQYFINNPPGEIYKLLVIANNKFILNIKILRLSSIKSPSIFGKTFLLPKDNERKKEDSRYG
jgi:hypothetical protein